MILICHFNVKCVLIYYYVNKIMFYKMIVPVGTNLSFYPSTFLGCVGIGFHQWPSDGQRSSSRKNLVQAYLRNLVVEDVDT